MSTLIAPLRIAVTHPARDPLGALRRLLIVDALVCAIFAALVLAVLPGLTTTGSVLIAAQALIVAATVVVETRALSAQRTALAQSVPA